MNNKRKGRGGSTAAGKSERVSAPPVASSKRSKTPDKDTKEQSPDDEFNGIYNNARFTHALTSLIGVHLRVETNNKDEYEGILKTFSPNLEIVLEMVHKIDPASTDTVDLQTVKEKMVFPFESVVRYFAGDVDLEFAMKESFQTDTQISSAKMNGESQLRDLEVWQPEDDCVGGGIEDDMNSNSWTPEEMFAKNEERFGVKTSFDPSLTGYTVPLNRDRVDSETEMRAARIAASIEGDSKSLYYTELENGDEEEAFSAVSRTGDKRNGRERESPGDEKSSAYVPPGKRDSRGGFSRGRGQRTPPPNRYDNYEDRDQRQRHGDRGDRNDRYSGSRGGGHREDRGNSGGHREDRGNSGGHREDRGGSGGHREERGGGYQDRGYHREERGYGGRQEREERGYGRQDSHGKKEDHRGFHDQGRGGQGHDQGRGGGYQDHRGQQNRPGSSHENRRDDRKSSEKISPLPPQETEKTERRRSGEMNRSPEAEQGALPQRDSQRRKQEKSKEQSTSDLKDFHQKFNLKLGDSAPPTQQQATTPTVSINPDPPGQPQASPRDNKTPTPRPSPKPVSPTQSSIASVPSSTPDLNKSSLNPNAKEFTLNPTAKEFTPRMAPRPSATPPRPQTPGTPGQMVPTMYTNIIPIQTQVGSQHMGGMPGNIYTPANQRPMRPSSKEGSGGVHIRQELPSPMQVQQVTGQPILAQHLNPPGYFNQGQIQYVQGGPGQQPIMRMVNVMPAGMMPGNLVHVPISSHGGGGGGLPGQGAGGVTTDHQQFIPTSQYQNSLPPHMWTQQVMSTPSPMHGSNGPPGPGGLPPPHNTMTPTPPAQGHTPAPSPGPQILGYPPQGPHQPNMPQYHMMMIPSGAGLPQFHQGPGNPGMGGNQLVGQPNMPQHFQYIQQGGQPIHMMPQHHQQHGQHPQHQQHPQHHQHQQQQQ